MEPSPEAVAAWARHFGSGYFTMPYLRIRLADLEAGRREAYGKEEEDRPAQILALRQLLELPGIQRPLF